MYEMYNKYIQLILGDRPDSETIASKFEKQDKYLKKS